MTTRELTDMINKKLRIIYQNSETLPDNELIYAEGKNKEGFEKLQIRLGKSKEELHRIIAALNTSL